jgi:hypothetical protein
MHLNNQKTEETNHVLKNGGANNDEIANGCFLAGNGAYGHGRMYTDDYEKHCPEMMGSGWMNWRK